MTSKAQAEAQAAAQAAYVARVVAAAPPLTPEQLDHLAVLFRPVIQKARGWTPPSGPSERELELRRKAQERDDALRAAKKHAESMTACDACGLQPDAHTYQSQFGMGYHEWEPGRAQKVLEGR